MKMKMIISLLVVPVLSVWSQTTVTPMEVRQAGLHVVEITTVNGEEPQGEIIYSPINPDSYNFKYINKVPCRIVISHQDNILFDSGEYAKNLSGATIRINGNTTALYSDPLNMPYKLKLEKSADLLFRGNDAYYGDKQWRLLKDAVSLNTIVALKLSQLLEMEWTADYIPCNVIINGDYRGCYLLIESVKRNDNCRIQCDQLTGAIVERDPYWWKESTYFPSAWYSEDKESIYRWTWKYPDEKDLTEYTEQYIENYINLTEESLHLDNYPEYIDILSWAKWVLAHDILGTRDSGGANMYFKKYDDSENTRLSLPCIWDFDSSYEITPGSFSRLHTSSHAYFSALFSNHNRTFAKAYVDLWNQKKENIITQLKTFLSDFPTTTEAQALDKSRLLYNKRFQYEYPTVQDDVNHTLQWLNQHIQPLDVAINSIDVPATYIPQTIAADNTDLTTMPCYNLSGIKVHLKTCSSPIVISRCSDGRVRKIVNRHAQNTR